MARKYSNNRRGAIFGMKNGLKNSLADLNRALELKPNNINSLQNRGIVY